MSYGAYKDHVIAQATHQHHGKWFFRKPEFVAFVSSIVGKTTQSTEN
jgi:hypothetical protein